MLNTPHFVDLLEQQGYSHFCTVPCSFAKNLINEILNRQTQQGQIEYMPCASEAVACSVAAGLLLAGKKPLLLVQSSGLTNMGSCITSLLKPYQINLPMLVSWRTYQSGDSEIQHQHLAKALPQLIEAYGYQWQILDNASESHAIKQLQQAQNQQQILLLQAGTFSPVSLKVELQLDLSAFPKRSAYLTALKQNTFFQDWVFIGTTGNTAREMANIMPADKSFLQVGNMGGALSLALGAAKAGKKVVVCGGDAEMVMHLGGMTTAGRKQGFDGRLLYLLFDNFSNKSTGGQQTFQQHLDYQGLALASGFEVFTQTVDCLPLFQHALQWAKNKPKSFVHIVCAYDELMPRPTAQTIINSKKVLAGE